MFHFLEIIFFALLAFTIISKLISILGTTNERDQERHKSFFGEPVIKDVTNINVDIVNINKELENKKSLSEYIELDNANEIIAHINELQKEINNFTVPKFIQGAKGAFELILKSFEESEKLNALVDSRYIEKFKELEPNYKNLNNFHEIRAKISQIYRFGKNVFIKVLFYNKNQQDFREEWTFSKSLLVANQYWYLANIEKIN